MTYEEQIGTNLKLNLTKANNNKIFLENIYNYNYTIPTQINNTIFIWNNHNNNITLNNRCNHIFIYNCTNIILRNVHCLTGITILNSNRCKILFKVVPSYTIEISDSFELILNSVFFLLPILFKNCSFTLVKSINHQVIDYFKILDDNIFSNWNYEYFNF